MLSCCLVAEIAALHIQGAEHASAAQPHKQGASHHSTHHSLAWGLALRRPPPFCPLLCPPEPPRFALLAEYPAALLLPA